MLRALTRGIRWGLRGGQEGQEEYEKETQNLNVSLYGFWNHVMKSSTLTRHRRSPSRASAVPNPQLTLLRGAGTGPGCGSNGWKTARCCPPSWSPTPRDSGPGSLRQAILDSNAATGQTQHHRLQHPRQRRPDHRPALAAAGDHPAVLIDGFSQPGYAGTPLIELSGSQAGGGDGLTITGSNVTVRGLDISGFSQGAGIHVTGTGATGDWIYGNFLGTDPTGTQAVPNNVGVEIDAGATSNLVGTNGDGVNDASERNLLSGNLFAGVWITGQGT